MMAKKEIPEGYMQNAQGHLVPEESVDPYDKMRDELVREMVEKAQRVRNMLAEFKESSMDDVDAFVDLSAERYNVQVGGDKGNLTLTSFDGRYRVHVAVADRIVFDERIHAAKKIIDECIRRWAKDSSPEIRALVEQAFQTDKEGKLNTRRILSLTRLDIKDDRWQEAMRAIKDSVTTASTKSYIRFYERDEKGSYENMHLDIAKL